MALGCLWATLHQWCWREWKRSPFQLTTLSKYWAPPTTCIITTQRQRCCFTTDWSTSSAFTSSMNPSWRSRSCSIFLLRLVRWLSLWRGSSSSQPRRRWWASAAAWRRSCLGRTAPSKARLSRTEGKQRRKGRGWKRDTARAVRTTLASLLLLKTLLRGSLEVVLLLQMSLIDS